MQGDPQLYAEQRARVEIDRRLELAGWLVQNYKDIDLTAAPGAAVREFPTRLVAFGSVVKSPRRGREAWASRSSWSDR